MSRLDPIRRDPSNPKQEKLAAEAIAHKKAWLLAAGILGQFKKLDLELLTVPDYRLLGRKPLRNEIDNLKSDFDDIAKHIIHQYCPENRSLVLPWFVKHFDTWAATGYGLLDLGRIHEVETAIGKLAARKRIDCPLYAQYLLQGGYVGVAIRHPEYHLAKDVTLLFNLLFDWQEMKSRATASPVSECTQPEQSLARTLILTCFNLLEAFANGLITEWLIANSTRSVETTKPPKKPLEKSSLSEKLSRLPEIVSSGKRIDTQRDPFRTLFGICKERRDSFVHCEPGPVMSSRGYVKEVRFHDADFRVAKQTLELTFEVICLVWKLVHGRERPSWLPIAGSSGRFLGIPLQLNKANSVDYVRKD